MMILKSWALVNYSEIDNMFKRIDLKACGLVYGDIRFKDEDFIITSRIVSADGRSIVTESGTHYLLVGQPEDGWYRWCHGNNWDVDLDKPLHCGFELTNKTNKRDER